HGHDVGDQVLKKVATVLTRVRKGGKVYRYGGEEFAILFPDKEADDVFDHLDELRATVAGEKFFIRSSPSKAARKKTAAKKKASSSSNALKITISIGLASPKSNFDSTDEVIKAADKALYRAKKAGRNQVKK
ncbi:MAG: GGDEF domain-containing protein, partial [Verrucomicrobiota bacterium]